MLLRLSEPSELIKDVIQDGGKILYPDQPEPMNRRGYTGEDFAFRIFKQHKIIIILQFGMCREIGTESEILIGNRIEVDLRHGDMLLIGYDLKTGNKERHAVAWDSEEFVIYDPNGTKYTHESFYMEIAYALFNMDGTTLRRDSFMQSSG